VPKEVGFFTGDYLKYEFESRTFKIMKQTGDFRKHLLVISGISDINLFENIYFALALSRIFDKVVVSLWCYASKRLF